MHNFKYSRCQYLILFVLLYTFWGIATAQTPSEPPATTITLLTWNIQMLPVEVGLFSWDKERLPVERAEWIISFLKEQPYDICVLQEVLDPSLSDHIITELQDRYPYLIYKESRLGVVGPSGGNLIASKIPIHYIKHTVYEHITSVDGFAEKGCLAVEGEKDGIPFQIIGTHLQAGFQAVKEQEYVELGNDGAKAIRKAGVPQILAGDFNTDAGNDGAMERLLAATEMQSFPLNDPEPYTADPKNYWRGPKKKAGTPDHVFLNPQGTASTIVQQTIQRAKREYKGNSIDLSDHYGIVATIRLTK